MAAIATPIYCMRDPVLFRSVVQKSPLRVVFSATTDSYEKSLVFPILKGFCAD